MFRPRIIPVLLLKDRGLVKTTKFAAPSYVGDPINAVRIFNDVEADELMFLDIHATREGRLPPLELVREISDEAFMPFTIGGGIRSLDDARAVFDMGAEKVLLNTAAFEVPGVVDSIAGEFGNQSVVVGIDARKADDGGYRVFTASGARPTDLTPAAAARQAEASGAGEVIINSIDRDGTMSAYDLELISEVTDAVRIPVIACGGAGDYEDLATPVAEARASAVAAGSLFVYVGKNRAVLINYPDPEEIAEIFAG